MGKILLVWILTRYRLLHLCWLHRTCVMFLLWCRFGHLFTCVFADTIVGKHTNERLWRLWWLNSRRATICIYCISGKIELDFLLFFSILLFSTFFFVLHVFEGTYIDIVENCKSLFGICNFADGTITWSIFPMEIIS